MNLLQVLKDSASVIYAKYIKDLSKNSIEDNEEILPIFLYRRKPNTSTTIIAKRGRRGDKEIIKQG